MPTKIVAMTPINVNQVQTNKLSVITVIITRIPATKPAMASSCFALVINIPKRFENTVKEFHQSNYSKMYEHEDLYKFFEKKPN